MGQVIQVNGDYNIKTKEGSNITLDTGPGVGNVVVTGNLLVEGDTLTISAENLNVKDNIIVLNDGETGAGVTLRYSGVQINRGTETDVSFLYDELTDAWLLATGTADSTLNYSDSKLRLSQVLTNEDTDSGDLTLIGTGTGVVKVFGTTTYEEQVTHDDDIPNKKYVDDAIQNNPTFQVVSNNSRVIVSDKDTAGSLAYLTSQTGYSSFGESAVSIIVDGQLNTQFYPNRAVIQDIEILDNEITNNNTNGNLFLRTQGTGKVQTNYALQIDNIGVTPAYVAGSLLLYSAPPSIGTTGVYFVNSARSGELINKNKALVFSMIF
jgi:hypothetical protein